MILNRPTLAWIAVTAGLLAGATPAEEPPLLHCYISTGDNHWLGQSLPIDSPASVEASFDLLQRLGVKRVYWRGLEAATWVEGHRERPESVRYFEFWKWLRWLYENVEPDRLAVEAAHKRGMEIWGVANLVDWGSSADTPPFKHCPFNSESRLRIEHPEWIPADKSGLLKQGGPLELASPEARRALVDLHTKFMKQDGYDGMTFLTYAENHSMRFQHEFGYNQPIVDEFRRRHGIDIRYQDWTRFATPDDWQMLRGEHVTQFLRELKTELDRIDQNFDDQEHWTPGKRGMVGDVNQVAARWGALLDEGPFITRDDALGDGQSLLVRRGGQSFTGQAIPPVHDDADYQLSFQVFRRNEVSALVVRLQGFDGSFQPELALNIADSGSVRLRDMRADTWIDTDLEIKPRRWTQIRLLANRRTETYTVSIHTPGEAEQHGSTAAPLTPQPNLRSIVIFPQPPQNSEILIDEIALTEVQ